MRIVLATQLLEPLDPEPRTEERSQEGFERQVHRTDAGAESVLIAYARSGAVVVPGGTVTGVQLGDTFAGITRIRFAGVISALVGTPVRKG